MTKPLRVLRVFAAFRSHRTDWPGLKNHRTRFVAATLSLAILLSAGARAVAPPHSSTAGNPRLIGQFLVASRRLTEPMFAQSVIYLVEHRHDGAMGLIVNRILGKTDWKTLGSAFGLQSGNRQPVAVYLGGPVDWGRGFVLHSADYRGRSTLSLPSGLSLSTGRDVIKALITGHGPKQSLLLLGYAGWGPGQLEHELNRGDWLLAPVDESLIFSEDPTSVWERALRNAGLPL